MSSVVKTLGVFSQERVIVERERSKGSYDVAPYFGAKLLAESPIGALFPLLFGALLYPTTGLHPKTSRSSFHHLRIEPYAPYRCQQMFAADENACPYLVVSKA